MTIGHTTRPDFLLWLLLFEILGGCQGSDRPVPTPPLSTPSVVSQTSTSLDPPLDPEMQKALDKYAPGFTRFAARAYAVGVDTSYRAEGDFNGDGIADLALYGHDQGRELLIVLLSSIPSAFTVVPLEERKLVRFEHGASTYLRTRAAGPLELPEEFRKLLDPTPPTHLTYPGIDVLYGNQAGELFYWNGSKFIKVATGD